MSDEPPPLERENAVLRRKLQRLERKMALLQSMQDQNASILRALMADLDAERDESERLLLAILPPTIAARLKAGQSVIADSIEAASILFADIVGFTPLSRGLSAEEMVAWLNEIYSAFDGFVRARGVEKIRTIGDNYMVAAGVPDPRPDHAQVLTDLALDIRDYIAAAPAVKGHRIDFRIGIHSGPVVGGIIGTQKFQYDLWGEAVNTASRMESHGRPGHIQISRATWELVRDHVQCERRGTVAVKGVGDMETWFVLRRAAPSKSQP